MDIPVKQPHIHHVGPVTKKFVDGLYHVLNEIVDELASIEHPDYDAEGWFICCMNWSCSMMTCIQKLDIVNMAVIRGESLIPEYHGKVIDIILSSIQDYRQAKAINFLVGDQPDAGIFEPRENPCSDPSH